jgi:uncharacterized lipoprotein YddW (UPF0748 family)
MPPSRARYSFQNCLGCWPKPQARFAPQDGLFVAPPLRERVGGPYFVLVLSFLFSYPRLLFYCLLSWLPLAAWAQVPPTLGAIAGAEDLRPAPPKRELRGFWVATVANIDWPNQRGEAPEQYRREYRRLLDAGQRAGLNAVFVQIRPASDAFYKSDLEPWSKYLTGRQGSKSDL